MSVDWLKISKCVHFSKICLVAPFLSRGAEIHNQKWTLKTNDVSEPLCRHYRNDVTHGQQELGTFFFLHEESPMCTSSALTLKLRLDNCEVPKMRSTIDLIELFSHDSHYQVQNDFCFWKRRILFLPVYFSSTSHTIKWSCRKNRKMV